MIWNNKDSDSIHVDPNHTEPNQPIPDNPKNIRSINDSAGIRAIEKIFSLPVHFVHIPYPVPSTQIFTYGTASDPLSPPYDS